MTRPGRHLPRAFAVLCALALVVPAAPEAAWAILVAVVAVLGVAVLERALLGRVLVLVERPGTIALPLDEITRVPLALHAMTRWPLRVTVRQTWPPLVEERATTLDGECRPGRSTPFDLAIRGIARGEATVEPPAIALTRWGFAERIVRAGEESRILVIPSLRAITATNRRLEAYALRGLGSRFSPRLGKGREFDRLREHVTGDDFRDMAWKASARHGKLITRAFRLERAQDVLICLDRGHRMAARVGRLTKLDHAVNATVVLAWLCSRMEDRVGLLSFAADVDQGVAQGRGTVHLRELFAFGTKVDAQFVHTDYLALVAHLRRRLRQRTLVLVMTDLPEGEEQATLVRAMRLLAPQHLPLVVVLGDPALAAVGALRPADHDELCRTLVARDVLASRGRTVRELRHGGALVVETSPGESGTESMNAYLDAKRRQLL